MQAPTDAPVGLELFYRVSVVLTGFSEAQLIGTGQGALYLHTFAEREATAWEWMSASWSGLGDDELAGEVGQMFQGGEYQTALQNLLLLWYSGQWYDEPNEDFSQQFIPAPESYVEGLVWTAIGAHPMGAKQQGFMAWAFPPPKFSID